MRSAPWFVGTLLTLVGCWSSKDSGLFSDGGAISDTGGVGASVSSGAVSGTDSATGGTGAQASGGTGSSDSGGKDTQPTSGASGSATTGGTTLGGSGGGGGQPIQIPVVTDCAMVSDAVTSDVNGHCYRVDFENLTFAQAVDACHLAGGHLATIASAEENDFVRDLHDGEHWIGASDGRGDMTPGAGTYQWVTSEAWTYSDWEDGQPNAFETDCPSEKDEDDCFEHCAFQSDEGDWNDRSCWHTVVSICEWDVEPKGDPGAGGASGAGGAGGATAE